MIIFKYLYWWLKGIIIIKHLFIGMIKIAVKKIDRYYYFNYCENSNRHDIILWLIIYRLIAMYLRVTFK